MERTGVGFIILVFVGVVVGVALLLQSAGYIGTMTETDAIANQTITFPTNDSSTTLELTGQNIVGDAIVTNASDGAVVNAANYTISQGLGADGQTAVLLTADAEYTGTANISYTYEPDGYVTTGAGRAMAGLIILFAAMGIAFMAFPDLRKVFG